MKVWRKLKYYGGKKVSISENAIEIQMIPLFEMLFVGNFIKIACFIKNAK